MHGVSILNRRLVFAFFFSITSALSFAKEIIVPLKLTNGCVLDLPVRFDAHSVTVLRQEIVQSSCPTNGRYSGMISLGVNIHVKFTTSERNYLNVRSGMVNEGKFEYYLQQNELPWQGLVWEDAAGVKSSTEIVRAVGTTSIIVAQRQLTNALALSGLANLDNAAKEFLAKRILDWNRDPAGHLQRYTSGKQTGFQLVSEGYSTDDPKARGRSARVM